MKQLKQHINLSEVKLWKQDLQLMNIYEMLKKEKINIKQIMTSFIKVEHYEISKLLNNSNVLKVARKNGSK